MTKFSSRFQKSGSEIVTEVIGQFEGLITKLDDGIARIEEQRAANVDAMTVKRLELEEFERTKMTENGVLGFTLNKAERVRNNIQALIKG